MKTNHSDAVLEAIEHIVMGRLSETLRYNRQLLNKLESQLESHAYQVLKASAKEVAAVTKAARIAKDKQAEPPFTFSSWEEASKGVTYELQAWSGEEGLPRSNIQKLAKDVGTVHQELLYKFQELWGQGNSCLQ